MRAAVTVLLSGNILRRSWGVSAPKQTTAPTATVEKIALAVAVPARVTRHIRVDVRFWSSLAMGKILICPQKQKVKTGTT
jgi:negative regulator of replication initiation